MLAAGARVETGPRFAPVLHELLHNRRRRDSDQTRLVGMLVQAGAKLEARDGDGCTALHAAVRVNALPEAKALLKAGADANATGRFHPMYQRGQPGPILFAAVDRSKLLALLPDHGADPQRQAEGLTLDTFIAAELARCAAELARSALGRDHDRPLESLRQGAAAGAGDPDAAGLRADPSRPTPAGGPGSLETRDFCSGPTVQAGPGTTPTPAQGTGEIAAGTSAARKFPSAAAAAPIWTNPKARNGHRNRAATRPNSLPPSAED